jgi:hypothetical protein
LLPEPVTHGALCGAGALLEAAAELGSVRILQLLLSVLG